MAKNTYSLAEAQAEARGALVDPTLNIPDAVVAGRSTEDELTVAKIIEIESQKATSLLGLSFGNKTVTITNAQRALVDAAKNAAGQAASARAKINEIEQKLRATPLRRTDVLNLQRDLNDEGVLRWPAICSSQDVIILFAGVRKNINEKIRYLPNDPVRIDPISRSTVITMPITPDIEGEKTFADHTVELVDGSGNVIAEDKGTINAHFQLSQITNLDNKVHHLKLRITNPTTNVIHEVPYILTINAPVPPVAPENMSSTLTAIPGERAALSGKLKTPGHVVDILDENGNTLDPAEYDPGNIAHRRAPSPNGTFHFSLPGMPASGTRKFLLRIRNTPGTGEHTEMITLNVSNPVASPIAPVAISDPARFSHTRVPFGNHHVHVHLDNPVAGSEVTISGQGLTTPVTVSIPDPITDLPPEMRDGAHVILTLPGFDTHTAGVKNMVIKTTDANNPTNTRETKFNIVVQEDLHHIPDNRKIPTWANFQTGLNTTHQYTLQNDPGAIRPYVIGRSAKRLGFGWYAEVPVLPGEEKWLGLRTKVRATTQWQLYNKVKAYLNDLNARAKAMNHSDHAHETPHDPAHPETPATTTPGTTPSSAEAHADTAHPTGTHPHGEGTFYDRSVEKVFGHGWIGKGLVGLKNLVPKPLRSLGGNTVGAGATSGAVGGAIYVGSLALGSAALASAIVPAMGVTFTASMVNRFLKWRKWWPHNKEDGGGHDAHGAGHGGH